MFTGIYIYGVYKTMFKMETNSGVKIRNNVYDQALWVELGPNLNQGLVPIEDKGNLGAQTRRAGDH